MWSCCSGAHSVSLWCLCVLYVLVQVLVCQVWRQSPTSFEKHVVLEHISEANTYELQTFKLTCQQGWDPSLDPTHPCTDISPRR